MKRSWWEVFEALLCKKWNNSQIFSKCSWGKKCNKMLHLGSSSLLGIHPTGVLNKVTSLSIKNTASRTFLEIKPWVPRVPHDPHPTTCISASRPASALTCTQYRGANGFPKMSYKIITLNATSCTPTIQRWWENWPCVTEQPWEQRGCPRLVLQIFMIFYACHRQTHTSVFNQNMYSQSVYVCILFSQFFYTSTSKTWSWFSAIPSSAWRFHPMPIPSAKPPKHLGNTFYWLCMHPFIASS